MSTYDAYKADWVRHLNSMASHDADTVKSAEAWIDEHLKDNEAWNKQLFCELLSDASQPLVLHRLAGKCLRMMLAQASPRRLESLRSNWAPELGQRLKDVVTTRIFVEDDALRREMLFAAVLIFGIETPKLWPDFLSHLCAELDGCVKCREDHAVNVWLNVSLEIARLGNFNELVLDGQDDFVKLRKLLVQVATQPGDLSPEVRDLSLAVLRRYVKLCPQLLVSSDSEESVECLQQFLASLEVPMKLRNAKLFASCLAMIKRIIKGFYDKIGAIIEKVHVLATLPWSSEFTAESDEFRLCALKFWTNVGRYEGEKLKRARWKNPSVCEDTLEDQESQVVNREIDLLFGIFVQELRSVTSKVVAVPRYYQVYSRESRGTVVPAFQAADAVKEFNCAAPRRMGAKILDTFKDLSQSDKWEDRSAASCLLWGLGDPSADAYVRSEVSHALIPGPTEFLLMASQKDQEPLLRCSALHALERLFRVYKKEYQTTSDELLQRTVTIFRETEIDATLPAVLEAELWLIPPLSGLLCDRWPVHKNTNVGFFFDFVKAVMVRGQKLDNSYAETLCSEGGDALTAMFSHLRDRDSRSRLFVSNIAVRLFPEILEMLRQTSTQQNTRVISPTYTQLCPALVDIIHLLPRLDKEQIDSIAELLLPVMQNGNADVCASCMWVFYLAIQKSPEEIPTRILETLLQRSEEWIRSGVPDVIGCGAMLIGVILKEHCNMVTKTQFRYWWNRLQELLYGHADLRTQHDGLIDGLGLMLQGAANSEIGIFDDPESISYYNDQVSRLLSTISSTPWNPDSESDAEYISLVLESLSRLHICYCDLFYPGSGKYSQVKSEDVFVLEREALLRQFVAYAAVAERLPRPEPCLLLAFANVAMAYGSKVSRKNHVIVGRQVVSKFLRRFESPKYPHNIQRRAREVLKYLRSL